MVLLVSGCGWGYANKMERNARRTPPPLTPVRTLPTPPAAPPSAAPNPAPRPAPRMAILVGTRTLSGLNANHAASAGARMPRDMRLHAFRLQRIDAFNLVNRWVHCTSGEVIEAKRTDSSMAIVQAMMDQGVPPGVWVLRVDPSGARKDLPNNAWYRHIVKYHQLEYVGQDDASGLVTYRYVGRR